jgi:hypothetical protein
MNDAAATLELAWRILARLERLSVDSHWARRASGARGNLLRCIEEAEGGDPQAMLRLPALIDHSYALLTRAAREISDPEKLGENPPQTGPDQHG